MAELHNVYKQKHVLVRVAQRDSRADCIQVMNSQDARRIDVRVRAHNAAIV